MKRARQIALVTGAGSGIGRAIALKLSGGGYYIIIVCRSRANALDTLAQLSACRRRIFRLGVQPRRKKLRMRSAFLPPSRRRI